MLLECQKTAVAMYGGSIQPLRLLRCTNKIAQHMGCIPCDSSALIQQQPQHAKAEYLSELRRWFLSE